jgi:NTE family protein
MTVKRGLVLAGGGLAGIAWETGVLTGIADMEPDTAAALLSADVLLGTSAGSTVAAQISRGLTLEALYARQHSTAPTEIDPGVSVDGITGLFVAALLTPGATKQQKLARIGEVALSTPTVPESVRRTVIAHRLPSHDWPDRDLRVTVIDTATGELVVFTRESGVELVDAVAASCAVPAAWPPVTIGDRRYMDGGVASSVHMAVVQDCDSVVVLVPSAEQTPSPWGVTTAEEIAGFPGATCAVFADEEAVAAFGPNPLDPRCRVPSAQAGRAQGRRVAAQVARFLQL